MGEAFSERKLAVKDFEVRLYRDAAVAEFHWDFVVKMWGDGLTLKTQGRETQLFHKDDRGWSLVHVHYYGMPVTGERVGL
jgi:hypothetical protein